MKKSKIAIIGCGNFAEFIHLPALRLIKAKHDNFELIATCDLNIAKAEKFAAGWNACHSYTNLDTMLKAEKPDGVMVYTNENATAAVACHILAAGIPCLLEKPPGKTVSEGRLIIAAAHTGDTFAVPAFNRRYAPSVMAARDFWIKEAGGETIEFVSCDFHRHNRINEDFSTCLIHGVDLVNFILGSNFKHAEFEYHVKPDHTDIFIRGEHCNGAHSQINCLPASGMLIEQYNVFSRNFGLRILFNGAREETGFIAYHNGKEIERGSLRRVNDDELLEEGGFIAENLNFIEMLNGSRGFPSGAMQEALNAIAVSESVRRRDLKTDFTC